MSDASLTSVLSEIYTAPLQAAVDAELQYRRIWADWLRLKQRLAPADADWSELSKTAPVVKVDARIEIAITMRISSAKEFKAGISAGLVLGPIHASGTFGFVGRSAQESVLQASTSVVLSNNDKDLSGFLAENNIKLAEASDVDSVVERLLDFGEGG